MSRKVLPPTVTALLFAAVLALAAPTPAAALDLTDASTAGTRLWSWLVSLWAADETDKGWMIDPDGQPTTAGEETDKGWMIDPNGGS